MHTRLDVTVGAVSVAFTLKPLGYLTARSAAASPEPGWGGVA